MKLRGPLVRFFLRTFFFRPANHPVLPFAIILIVFLHALRSIDRMHVGLIVYATVLAHGVVGGLFRSEDDAGGTDAARFFRGLPLSSRTVVRSYLMAGAIHALVSLAVLGAILEYSARLPRWESVETLEGVDDAGNPALIVRGFDRDERLISHEVSMVLPRSYLVETVRQAPRARALLAVYFVAMFVYLACWHVYREAPGVPSGRRALGAVPLALYAALGGSLVAEYFVAPGTLHRWYQDIPGHESAIIAVLVALIGITSITGLVISHAVSGSLRRG